MRADLKCVLTTKKEMVIMWSHGGVGQHYGDNHIVIYQCIKSTSCTPYTYNMLMSVISQKK